MIEGIGYTEDGKVWMSMLVTWNGEHGKIVATFTPEMAVDIAGLLVKASDGAKVHAKETIDVGNRSNLN